MMFFQQPIWFFLLIPIVCSLYFWRIPSKLVIGLRFAVFLLIVLAMAQPMLKLPARSGTIIVVADRSRSMPTDSATAQKHAVNLLLSHIGKEDRLGVVSFGAKSFSERIPAGLAVGTFGEFTAEIQADASNLSGAIENALSLIPVGDKGRLLLLSDGRWTGDSPAQLVSQLVQRGIAVDYRVMERPVVGDIAILSLDAPDRVLPEEVFKVTAWVQVPVTQDVEYELLQNGVVATTGTRSLTSGNNRFEFRLKAGTPGALSCELRIRSQENDPVPENNSARKLVGVEGNKPLLVLVPPSKNSSAAVSKLADILNNSAIETETSNASGIRWSLPFLSRYSGIVLENVPSSQLGVSSMELIAEWLKQTGSGLMLTGGKNSYALGGYYQSPFDPILPVSMELRKEHRKLAVAVAILMDCSGSMGMTVPGGKIKMDLANLGAAEVLNILTPMDEVAVLTCDTGVQTIIPLKQNTNPQGDRGKILTVGPGGGGIFVYVGLAATSKILATAQADTKHIILFTDADDTEQPDDYIRLLTACKNAGMTCSVIALGTEAGMTADLCKDIANVGGGNIYFTEQANDLPRLFALDTFTISRSTFLEDPTPFHFTGGITTLTGTTLTAPPNLGGYNLCYAKPGALVSALTDDDYKAPIIASWQAGLGRVLCYTGQVDGSYTGPMADWQDYPSMLTSLGRWTAGRTETLPNNMMLTQQLDDGSCQIRLHLDPEQDHIFETLPIVTILKQTPGVGLETETVSLRWLEPSMLGVNIILTGNETIQATVLLTDKGESTPKPFQLPPVCLPYSPEFRPSGSGKGAEILRHLAATTGGCERMELPGMWNDIPKVPRYFDLSVWLIYVAILCLVAEIFQRRTGLISSWSNRWSNRIRRVFVLREQNRPSANSNNNRNNSNTDTNTNTDNDDSNVKSLSLFRRFAMRREQRKILQREHSGTSAPRSESITPAATQEQKEEAPTTSGGVSDALHKARQSSKNRTGK
ncbi:MAG: VWA domain-containing protein [Planctomycetaceae bacterium]|jgi:Mg-chelatase subunit ChlD|nr:VWA domain-containing protein [Planctomycetaceae bacterium]